MKKVPIIFIHKGYSEYLEYSLRQAEYMNPESEIILIGDDANNRFDFLTHVDMSEYFDRAESFAAIYQHYSTNPYDYELFCFQRWFALEDYLKDKGYEEAFVCDSDVMLYIDIDKLIRAEYKDIDVGVVYNVSEEHVSIGLSYWNTKYLQLYNDCVINAYSDEDNLERMNSRWKAIVTEHGVGAISDMTIAMDFYQSYKNKIKIISFEELKNDSVFENNINVKNGFRENEYQMRLGIKKLRWNNKLPYGYNLIEEKWVRFYGLHCQGPAKFLTSKYYSGNYFSGKLSLDIKFRLLSILAFWYKILRIRYRFAFIFDIIQQKKKEA